MWIGRLFARDNDNGEHWFDNGEQRQAEESAAAAAGLEPEELLIVVPARFKDGRNGPCHSGGFRKRFWTDVLKSLELSLDLPFDEAREINTSYSKYAAGEFKPDLEDWIEVRRTYGNRRPTDGSAGSATRDS